MRLKILFMLLKKALTLSLDNCACLYTDSINKLFLLFKTCLKPLLNFDQGHMCARTANIAWNCDSMMLTDEISKFKDHCLQMSIYFFLFHKRRNNLCKTSEHSVFALANEKSKENLKSTQKVENCLFQKRFILFFIGIFVGEKKRYFKRV